MRPGLTIKIEDEGDKQFKPFSLLKDHDVRYETPTGIGLNFKGDVNNERVDVYERRKEENE